MIVQAVGRPSSLRDIPWPTWVLLALAALVLVRGFTQPVFAPVGTLTFAAPLLFAAAVVYVAPADRRFVWAAILLAVSPAAFLIGGTLPDVWFDMAPGDWKNATPLLMDLADIARQIANVLTLVGLGLLGLALGGMRNLASAVILGVGFLFGALVAIRFLGNPIEGMDALSLAQTLVFPVLLAIGWAFVFAAALESRRRLMLVGTGLLFAILAVGYTELPETLFSSGLDVLFTALAVVNLVGWALLIVAALRGELTAARSGESTRPS